MDHETIAAQNPPTTKPSQACEPPKKRGKRVAITTKTTPRGPEATPPLSLLLANVCSRENKLDEIRLTQQEEIIDCCACCDLTPLQHPGSNVRTRWADIVPHRSQTTMRVDGLCVYIKESFILKCNQNWWTVLIRYWVSDCNWWFLSTRLQNCFT